MTAPNESSLTAPGGTPTRERVRCNLCGELTARPVPIWYQVIVAPDVNVPGSQPKNVSVCKSCADLLTDEDAADYYDDDAY